MSHVSFRQNLRSQGKAGGIGQDVVGFRHRHLHRYALAAGKNQSLIDSCHVLVDNLKTRKQVNAELDKAFLKDEIDFEQYVRASDKEAEENQTAEDANVRKFYQIDARIISKDSDGDENEFSRPFIVYAHNATRASVLIEKFLNDEQDDIARRYAAEGDEYEKREVFSHIEECRIINISAYIPLEFSKAYSYAEED